ncbi:MAG: hypothetical protein VZS44_03080 [Bacilli bacterium]|nr:hypothetical protein [Bacilli bacterium]
MKKEQNNNKLWKSILKALKKRLHLRYILFIALVLAGNTFAWFIYMDKISGDIDVKIKSWNVSFKLDNQDMTDYINFTVDEIYPGMTPYNQTLSVTNDGEVDAQLYYEIISVKVLDEYYTTEDGVTTEDQLKTIMRERYPFKIQITTNQALIGKSGGTAMFYINVTWPYESVNSHGESNDDLDTYWGEGAHDFIANNPGIPCIKVKVKLSAIQVQSTTTETTTTETTTTETTETTTTETTETTTT